MTLLGLDFDNTLVTYDNLFHQLAIEKNLIEPSMPSDKISIRNYLRSKGLEERFTLLQGEVYGLRILDAQPADGMLEALHKLQTKGIDLVLVSHKTRTPYKGPLYDLHQAALSWLEKHGFFASSGLNWSKEQVFFEVSKEAKIRKIESLGCTDYIDDLPEILAMLPNNINGILYDPNNSHIQYMGTKIKEWKLLPESSKLLNG